ncbi:hypothetical protein V5O48_009933 [Marasmius crinis-equi]|uniref:Uncharacterized protein n=1 Tax=Marasmius crinis-equi TaxID=585013 RepID=A0ABR3F9W5_9AGAR
MSLLAKGVPAMITEFETFTRFSLIKNVTIASECPKIGGGVFHQIFDRNKFGVSASATGDFLILSASLTAVTSNRTYFDFAEASVEFIHRLHQGNGLSKNYLNVRDCTEVKKDPSLLHDIVAGATSNGAWNNGVGMLRVLEDGERRAHLMRGYTELYRANNTPTDLKAYLKSHISNQARIHSLSYNAVTDTSVTKAGSNIYGNEWDGDGVPAPQFSNWTQAAAIAALLGSMVPNQDGDESTSSVNHAASLSMVLLSVVLWVVLRQSALSSS